MTKEVQITDKTGKNYAEVDSSNDLHTISKITDGTNTVTVDDSNGLVIVDETSNKIHSGNHFYVEGYIILNTDDSYYVKLVTPNTNVLAHITWLIESGGVLTTTFDEGASGGMTGGSSVTPLNNNRNSETVSTMTITSNVSAPTSYDTRISNKKVGGTTWKAVTGGQSAREEELILKKNTTYCRTFTSGSDNNLIAFKAMWSEYEL